MRLSMILTAGLTAAILLFPSAAYAKEKPVAVYYQGYVKLVDAAQNKLVIEGTKDDSETQMLIQLEVDPKHVWIIDANRNEIEMALITAGDYVQIDCVLKDGEIQVDNIFVGSPKTERW